MRIGFLGPFCTSFNSDYGSQRQVGAIEQQFFGVAQQLVMRGHEVTITRNWCGKKSQDWLAGVRLLNVNSFSRNGQGFSDSEFPKNQLSYLSYLRTAPSALAGIKPDVVVTTGILQSWIASRTLRRSGARRIFIANNNDVFIERGVGHTRTPYITKLMFHRVSEEYDAIVALTERLKNYLNERDIDCEYVIPNAVDPSDYTSGKDERFILTSSRFVPHKKNEDLINAFAALQNETDSTLIVIGSGRCEGALRRLVLDLGLSERIHFSSFLPKAEYRGMLSRCSFFVLPSEAEAFGVVVIEAMASGKAVIARNIIGPGDIITHNHDGYLFNHTEELVGLMRLLLYDLAKRKQLEANARETVERRYSFANVARMYEDMCESLEGN